MNATRRAELSSGRKGGGGGGAGSTANGSRLQDNDELAQISQAVRVAER